MDIHIAIDDFGTGYSSLAYLEREPVDAAGAARFMARPAAAPYRALLEPSIASA